MMKIEEETKRGGVVTEGAVLLVYIYAILSGFID